MTTPKLKLKKSKDASLADCRLIIPGIESGKQGKSTILSHMVEWYRYACPELAMRLYDPDPTHRTLSRMFSAPGAPGAFTKEELHRVIQLNYDTGPESFTQLDAVTDGFAEAPIAIVDSVAQKLSSAFGEWVRSVDFQLLQEEFAFRVLFVCPITSESATIMQTQRTINAWKEKADYLIVVRTARGKDAPVPTDWERPGNAETRELAARYGARVISYPTFFDATTVLLKAGTADEPEDLALLADTPMTTLRAAVVANNRLAPTAANRVSTEWIAIKKTLDSVANILLPPAYTIE